MAVGRESHALAHRAVDRRCAAVSQVDNVHRLGGLPDRGRKAAYGQRIAVGRECQADGRDALADRLGRLPVSRSQITNSPVSNLLRYLPVPTARVRPSGETAMQLTAWLNWKAVATARGS